MDAVLPSWLILDPLLQNWLSEDVGRGDLTTQSLFSENLQGKAEWMIKEDGIIAGLPIAARIFKLLDHDLQFIMIVNEGTKYESGKIIASLNGSMSALLTGERVALNLVMHLSGIATMTRKYVDAIADYPTHLVDTRKTIPGLRILEKYASRVGGAQNHRMGLDDSVMIKDNHIKAVGGIDKAMKLIKNQIPYPLTIEVETTNLEEVEMALVNKADLIMLDNMSIDKMKEAVKMIRKYDSHLKIEASGNITLQNIAQVAETGVDYISTSATITRSTWLDLSMNFI